MAGGHLLSFGVLAQGLTDAEATRRVFLTAGGLLLVGIALLIATVWWWRSTRPEHPVLAPLEVMSERRWSKATENERRTLLEQTRTARQAADAAAAAAPVASGAAAPMASVPVMPAGASPMNTVRTGAEPERVDLSQLVAAVPVADADLAEIDALLGLAPSPAGRAALDAVPAAAPPSDDGRVADADSDLEDADADAVPVAEEAPASVVIDDSDEVPLVIVDRVGANGTSTDGDDMVVEDDGRSVIDPLLQRTSIKD